MDLAATFRKARRPVIYTRQATAPDGADAGMMAKWWEDLCYDGTEDSEILPQLKPEPVDTVIRKTRYNAFMGTELDSILRGLGVRDIVITGVMTNVCCETTARDAFMRDYRVFFCADGTGSQSEELHLGSLRALAYAFAKIVTTKEMRDIVEGKK